MCRLVYVYVCMAFRLRNGRSIHSRQMCLNPTKNNKVSPAFSKGAGVQWTPLRSRSADRAVRSAPRINNKVSPAFSKAAESRDSVSGRAPQSAKPPCFKKRRGFRDPRRGSLPHLFLRLLRQQKPTIIYYCPIRRCVNWFMFTSVRLSGYEMG